MFNIPNGGGAAFTNAAILGGAVDATITLTLLDGAGVAIANFPFEDAWIDLGRPTDTIGGGDLDESGD